MTTGRPGAAHLALPFDVQRRRSTMPMSGPSRRSAVSAARRAAPDPAAVTAAAQLLRIGRKAAVHLRRRRGDLRRRSASSPPAREALGAPVATTISGKGAIDEHAPARRRRGRLERRHAADAGGGRSGGPRRVRRLPRRLGHHRALAPSRAGQGRGSSIIDVDPAVIGANYQIDVGAGRRCEARARGAERGARCTAARRGPGLRMRRRREREPREIRGVRGARAVATTRRSGPSVWSPR